MAFLAEQNLIKPEAKVPNPMTNPQILDLPQDPTFWN